MEVTPKQKADELIEKYKLFYKRINEYEKEYNVNLSIECSIIAVDEVLMVLENELLILYSNEARTCNVNQTMQLFYKEVKQELIKMK